MAYAATSSRLTVLLLTDIVGSTDLKSRLGLAEYARRLARHDQIFKHLIEVTRDAEILKDTGDGYFASFMTTSDAVRFALRFQQALHEEKWSDGTAAGAAAADPLRVRIGIHVGEVAQMDKEQTGKPKIVGMAADIVSRVMHLALGGQILLTRFAFNEARQFVFSDRAPGPADGSDAELTWVAHGPYLFKGADEPIDIFEVGVESVAPLTAPPDNEDARRVVPLGEDETLGWRPAAGSDVPDRPQWELQRRLGEGGFGEVWLARHVKLGSRRVFKFCFDADRLRSFKRELTLFRILQESLGDRPDIARIFEVKLDRPPYFLESEYTEGGNLQDWSDMEGGIDKIPLGTRLEIVARVAEAAAAAHSVGVLHKDIKPSNILIALDAGQPRPRLADFGIGIVDRSRVQPGQPITMTGFTLTGDLESSQTGTRLYIPPEVLVGAPFTVQGDVYALGVLLYQMICADLNRPLAEGWQRDVEDELLREDIAACVDGDPARRLSSAADLSKRLRSLGARREWRMRSESQERLARRRQRVALIALGAAGALMLLLVLVGTFAWRERSLRREAEAAQRAEKEQRAIADAVGTFVMDMLKSVSPDTEQGRDATVLQALGVAEKQLEERQWHPEVEAYLRNTIATAYRTLGEFQRAEPHARRSVQLIEQLKGDSHPDTHNFRGELAMALQGLGQYEAALETFRASIGGLKRTLGEEHDTTLSTIGNYALLLLELNRNDEAEPIVASLVDAHVRRYGPDHQETLIVLSTHAGLLYQRGKYAESAELFGRIYETRRKQIGDDHPTTIAAAQNYASLLYRLARNDEAMALMEKVVESQRKAVGPEHPRTLDAMLNLAQMKKVAEDTDGAVTLLKQVLEIRTRKLGAEHPDTLHTAGMLGGILAETRPGEAEPLLRQTLELQRKTLPPNDLSTINSTSALASALENQGKPDEAEPLHRAAYDMTLAAQGADHPLAQHHRWLLGRCLVKVKRLDEAEPILLDGLSRAQRAGATGAPGARMTGKFATELASLYDMQGRMDEAARYRAIDLASASQPATAPATQTAGQAATQTAAQTAAR
jgi:serine/threonine-protein kinase